MKRYLLVELSLILGSTAFEELVIRSALVDTPVIHRPKEKQCMWAVAGLNKQLVSG